MTGTGSPDAFYDALLEDDPRQLYEQAPCGYLSTTPDGDIVKVNETFLALTGYSREELVGTRAFVQLLTGGGRIYHETHLMPMLRMHGSVGGIALDLVRADGERMPVLINAVLDRDANGAPRAIRAAVFDATDRRAYERELLREKQRAEQSEARARALARTLQQTLIPPSPPRIPGLDVAARYRPAGSGDEVGGDFYDVFQIGEDDWVVTVGDVRGKGVEAAVITALARYTLRGATVQLPRPSQALATLNEVLLREDTDRFCTVALLRLQRQADAWRATVSLGGHAEPLLARNGRPPVRFGAPGMLLGVLPAAELLDAAIQLQPGDSIVLFTDGVTEARSGPEFYCYARLVAAVSGDAPTADFRAQQLLDEVLDFQRGIASDDIAIVVVRVPEPSHA